MRRTLTILTKPDLHELEREEGNYGKPGFFFNL